MNGWDWVLVGVMALGGLSAVFSYLTAIRYRKAVEKSHRDISDVSDSPLHQVAIGLGLQRQRRTPVSH
jgi:hypothetical protein